jgi:hypothetical protein
MEEVISKAIQNIEGLHLLRCKALEMTNCKAKCENQIINLIAYRWKLEERFKAELYQEVEDALREAILVKTEKRIRSEIAGDLEEARDFFIIAKEAKSESLASWILDIFNMAIRFVEEK